MELAPRYSSYSLFQQGGKKTTPIDLIFLAPSHLFSRGRCFLLLAFTYFRETVAIKQSSCSCFGL